MTSKSLVLLSGEATSLPMAEARALFSTYDPNSKFSSPEERVLIVESDADPFMVSSRIAFARRVGLLVADASEGVARAAGRKLRFRNFDLVAGGRADPDAFLAGFQGEVDLSHPDYELTLVRGRGDYLALTAPGRMSQTWSERRPRARPYFHPSAIFPKLSRALVNLSRCKEGGVFLDPFAGTGSLPLEAALVGAKVVALDVDEKMTRGAASNMRHYGQEWLGLVRADALAAPLATVDAVATDVPYGRASSTKGRRGHEVLRQAIERIAALIRPGSRLVVMHAREMAVPEDERLVLEEEHHLYVHKLLTRTVTVLRRR